MSSKRRMVPVFGGLTAAATAAGAVAPLAQVAVAAPAPDTGSDETGTLGLAQDGTFESCSAYFGFGKDDDEAANATGFEVVDASGDDEGGHAVPDDVQVVLVIETDGGTIECIPEAITEAEWNEAIADDWPWFPDTPAFPDHPVYAYPSADGFVPKGVEAAQYIDGVGVVISVGYRVIGVPEGHTLVSPTGVQPLPDHHEGLGSIEDLEAAARVVALVEAEVGPEAAAALAAAFPDCVDDDNLEDGTDPDLLAAINFLAVWNGWDAEYTDVSCYDVWDVHGLADRNLALLANATHVEAITLAGPTAPDQPVPPAPTPPAAQPVTAAPSFTG